MLGDLGNKHSVSAGTLQALHVSVSDGSLASVAGLGILLLGFAAAGILARAFPRWLAWSALALGILQLVPTPTQIGFLAGLVVLPWMLAAGVAMFRRPDGATRRSPQHQSTTSVADPAVST